MPITNVDKTTGYEIYKTKYIYLDDKIRVTLFLLNENSNHTNYGFATIVNKQSRYKNILNFKKLNIFSICMLLYLVYCYYRIGKQFIYKIGTLMSGSEHFFKLIFIVFGEIEFK